MRKPFEIDNDDIKETYTQEQVALIVKYAMGYQKAYDDQTAGGILIKNDLVTEENCIELLDELANDKTAYDEVDWNDALEE